MKTPASMAGSRHAAERAEWRRVVRLLEARGPVDPGWAPMVERYCRARCLADRAWSEVGDEITSPGSHGGVIIDPATTLALKAEAEAARYGQCLGLEPQAPARPTGRPVGATSAPDRKAAAPPRVARLRSVS